MSLNKKCRALIISLYVFSNSLLATSASGQDVVTLASSAQRLSIDLKKGTFNIVNLRDTIIKNAYFSADGYTSTSPDRVLSAVLTDLNSPLGKGRAMKVDCVFKDGMRIQWKAEKLDSDSFFTFSMGFVNKTKSQLQLMRWSPVEGGDLYPGLRKLNAKMLDGNGGGEETAVSDAGYLRSRNNLLFTFDDAAMRRLSLVLGGISYTDFEKHAAVTTPLVRRGLIAARDKEKNRKLLSYLDLGEDSYGSMEKVPHLTVNQAWPHRFFSAKNRELGTAVYNGKAIIVKARHLMAEKKYAIGFSWMDDNGARVQTVYADNGEGTARVNLISKRFLPETAKGKLAEELICKLPITLTSKGNVRIIFERNKGENAVLSEVWLSEGWPSSDPERYEIDQGIPEDFYAAMYASDPVGKRIDAGGSYEPTGDRFYLDGSTADPFRSMEIYGRALKKYQGVNNLQPYTFPTICLWYASHRNYGAGPSVNDSRGAVEEMQRAIKSGFTRFSTASIRLVPDNYELNNEQGWWDDEHWQKYGSGSDNPNSVIVEGAHYKPPFETTKKWASEVSRLGGIPLTYFQTARRSQDFCDTYPGYMLFNKSNYSIPDSNWLTLGKASYDFTDRGFIVHMKSVYANLNAGGVRGLMFDYTSTAWADYGGMEDKYSTAAAMYRNVFKLAHDGLSGPHWLDERNLERGTDLTLGLVASQRVWGDTDGITDEMVSRTGLRWYKNRVVVAYDMDSKNTEKLRLKSRDYLRQMLTMAYVASGRLLLGNSFAKMSKEDLYDLSRVYPFPKGMKSARPVDAFVNQWPTIYQYKVNNDWTQLTLYNPDNNAPRDFKVSLSALNYQGGLELSRNDSYYMYDFWNDHFLGKISGADTLVQNLRIAEARMISVHKVILRPQLLSSSRHIMQGLMELENIGWSAKPRQLKGKLQVKANDPVTLIFALNGYLPVAFSANQGVCKWSWIDKSKGIIRATVSADKSMDINWILTTK